MTDVITIIGGGLAGTEAAWQAANLGVKVRLYEMRPEQMTPAHHTDLLGELVCSNSLKGKGLDNAAGLLKEEMRRLNSLFMAAADRHQIPAGGALAVDRTLFAREITGQILSHRLIEVIREEKREIPEDGITVIATGPLTSELLAQSLKKVTGAEDFYFYDAAAPIVTQESIDMTRVFRASRYGKGDADYLNCPMSEEDYRRFYDALVNAERHEPKEFEKEIYFEGCMPVEALAKRGYQTLLFGPLKPVGLIDPRTGKRPFAVVQLRQDNREGTLYNLVGFQTGLKWPEQKRVFSMIPGLEQAEFVRYGVIHRNTFINSPRVLSQTLSLRESPRLFFAGQITGVEGYVESAATGLIAGINAARLCRDLSPLIFPRETALGSLCHYLVTADTESFQPMNINFGLLPRLPRKIRDKQQRNLAVSELSLKVLTRFISEHRLVVGEKE